MTSLSTEPSPARSDTFSNFQNNSLYILLYKDRDPNIRFHWGLYHFLTSKDGGWKFDIIRPGGHWRASVPYIARPSLTDIDNTYGDGPLTCAVRIASVPKDSLLTHKTIVTDDQRLDELNQTELDGGLNCKVYVRRALLNLKSLVNINGDTWDALEREVLHVGESCREDAEKQSVLVVDSHIAPP